MFIVQQECNDLYYNESENALKLCKHFICK